MSVPTLLLSVPTVLWRLLRRLLSWYTSGYTSGYASGYTSGYISEYSSAYTALKCFENCESRGYIENFFDIIAKAILNF